MAPGTARKLGAALAAREGIAPPDAGNAKLGAHRRRLATTRDKAS
jgi:hypothetical protein